MKSLSLFLVLLMPFIVSCSNKPDIAPYHNQLLVYPNPVTDYANVMVKNFNNEPFKLSCFDTKGGLILENSDDVGQKTYQIDLYDKPAGVYRVILFMGSAKFTDNIIKR